jgi:hypothetical protein
MEEAPENDKESSHSAHASGMNEYSINQVFVTRFYRPEYPAQFFQSVCQCSRNPDSLAAGQDGVQQCGPK